MENQEQFIKDVNRAIEGVILQGEPSLGKGNCCSYRGEGGLKCAVGMLIKDEEYTPLIELGSIRRDRVQCVVGKSLGYPLEESHVDVLAWVQNAHDCSRNEADFRHGFVERIKEYEGIPQECKQFAVEKLEEVRNG